MCRYFPTLDFGEGNRVFVDNRCSKCGRFVKVSGAKLFEFDGTIEFDKVECKKCGETEYMEYGFY